MSEAAKDSRHASVKWIIGLCLAATVAIVGWTVTATLAARMRTFEQMKAETSEVKSIVMAANVRISVLENKYDTIQASLAEIKALLQKHTER